MSVRKEIDNATNVAELKSIVKRLQLRKIPSGLPLETLRQMLINVVGNGEVYVTPICNCKHTKKQHFMNNKTGEAFECKMPNCDCKKYQEKL